MNTRGSLRSRYDTILETRTTKKYNINDLLSKSPPVIKIDDNKTRTSES